MTSWLTSASWLRRSAQPVLADVDAVEQHRAAVRVVEARQQADQRRLAAARAADDRHGLARRDPHANAGEHLALVGVVGEGHVAELDLAPGAIERDVAAAVLGRGVEHLEDALPGRDALLQRADHADQAAQRRRDQEQRRQERRELADREAALEDVADRHVHDGGEPGGGDHLHDRIGDGLHRDELHEARAVELVDLLERLGLLRLRR